MFGFDMIKNKKSAFKGVTQNRHFDDVHRNLLNSDEDIKAILEGSGDGILIMRSQNGEIIGANDKISEMTGYRVSELQGMKLSFLIPEQEVLLKIIKYNPPSESVHLRAILRQQNGALFCSEIGGRAINRNGKELRVITIGRACQEGISWLSTQSHAVPECPINAANDDSETVQEFPNIIGKSPQIRKICKLIGHVAKTDSTVLIQGESGTGKEIAAEAIHFHSPRSKGPFVKVNCAALSETLLESELFGHVKGAFTGAIRDHKGRFMQANNGTIFLDEISCMSLSSQAKLLRVIQEREFELVGSSITATVNVRIIVASNFDLEEAVAKNKFRNDLYYRLSVFPIYMPPLREKKEDIPLLARHFLKKYNLAIGKKIRDLTSETLALMRQHDWPGNVRELENAIEHAVIVCKSTNVSPSCLPSNLTKNELSLRMNYSEKLGLRDMLNLYEKQIIQDALLSANGVKKRAADLLRIDPRNFPHLLRKHKL